MFRFSNFALIYEKSCLPDVFPVNFSFIIPLEQQKKRQVENSELRILTQKDLYELGSFLPELFS